MQASSWLQPHKYPWAGGRAILSQAHAMGHLQLLVLGFTCCLAAVSSAKVSESPAEEAGPPVLCYMT